KKEIIKRSGTDYIGLLQQKTPEDKTLISGVSSAVFSYYAYNANTGMYEWSEEWLEEDLPQAVRITMTLTDSNDNTVNYHRTVNIPAGKLEFFKD
ncbi:MAG: type II secretion system protein GspJ, partial [Candidatus Omnitrophica bacterium]|nr:type II secretion system protein GspJ [Candidatus Omnitrophota bacterium]